LALFPLVAIQMKAFKSATILDLYLQKYWMKCNLGWWTKMRKRSPANFNK